MAKTTKEDIYTQEYCQNFNKINWDFSGLRSLQGKEELVQYQRTTSHRIWLNDLPDGYSTHWHTSMEIIRPVTGDYDVFVTDTWYHLTPGSILLIPPREIHHIKESPMDGMRFVFLLNTLPITELKGYSEIQNILKKSLCIRKDEQPQLFEEVDNILSHMKDVYYQNDIFTEFEIYSLLLQLYISIGKSSNRAMQVFANAKDVTKQEYSQKFNQLLEYIDDHYMEDMNLDDTAQLAGFSKCHFSRLFKQYTDFTFCDYLNYRRIKAAQALLADPDKTVTEVAFDTGFPSISTFYRVFKQLTGCSPKEYRSKKQFYEYDKL